MRTDEGFGIGLQRFLSRKFPGSVVIQYNRSWLKLEKSGTMIYVNGSKKYDKGSGWYDLDESVYRDLIAKENSYQAIILGQPQVTFVLPKNFVRHIFSQQPQLQSQAKNPRWMFSISENNSRYLLTVNKKAKFDISEYLNKWDIISEFTKANEISNGKENELLKEIDVRSHIFLTGYNERNLEISKRQGVLGWVNKSNFLSIGSLVFVFNKDTLRIETCFRIKSQSSDKTPIWEDEKTVGKVIYGNRWNAEVVRDGLNISLTDINKISPFDKEPFQGLLRGNFPMPLNSPKNEAKYKAFLHQLLSSIQAQENYWIFVVTDQSSFKLSAEEIYDTRMKDRFWGLNEHTPHRKHLKKGDKVIFARGARTFLGTASLDSDPLELNNTLKDTFSHGIEFYKAQYGIMLSDIVTWQDPKKIENYVNSLSFIADPQQYPVYFQDGIKKISISEYDIITKTDRSYQDSVLKEISLWLVRAGDEGQWEQEALEKNLIRIGYNGLPGLDSINEFEAFKEHYAITHTNEKPRSVGQNVPQIWNFIRIIRKGDLVILPRKTERSELIAVGQIIGDYKYEDPNSEIKQFRPVKWLKKDVPRNKFDPDIERSFDIQGTVRYLGNFSAVNKVKIMLERLGIDTTNIDDIANYESHEFTGIVRPPELPRSWLSLTDQEIKEVTDRVLEAQGKKLEIERSVIRRIISHLILSKHVILVGPPGTGKTDLARRLLRELGKKLLGRSEPLERVASYEWGRYEVIGGISITADSRGDSFHLGCVTHAIKEGKLLLIDEFNRADMNKAFGEMFLAIDHGVIQLKEDENPSGGAIKLR